MTKVNKIISLYDDNNIVVAQHSERNYPGLLIQGDTFKIFLDEVEELQQEAVAGDVESVIEIANILKVKITDLLANYERVLYKHSIELPYFGSVHKSNSSLE